MYWCQHCSKPCATLRKRFCTVRILCMYVCMYVCVYVYVVGVQAGGAIVSDILQVDWTARHPRDSPILASGMYVCMPMYVCMSMYVCMYVCTFCLK